MTNMQLSILKDAMELKIASIKRAINTNKNPRFREIYDLELSESLEVQVWLNQQKPDEKK